MRLLLPLVACAALAGCGILPPEDTARMPPNQYGGPLISQNEAIGLSSFLLKDPANTHGNPEQAARAIAAEDWLAGQTRLSPDFGEYDPVATEPWGDLRRQVRAAIGVAPGTPSQVVVDHLLAAAAALHAGDRAAAEAQLQPPAFTLGPQGTLAALGNLPKFPGWYWAYDDLRQNENRNTGCRFQLNC